jgi:hypothetical protein
MINTEDLINEHLKREESREKIIGKYYPSDMGRCMRKIYYSYVDPKPFDADLIKIFAIGIMIHDFFNAVFANSKKHTLIANEEKLVLEIDDIIISGRADDIVLAENGKDVIVWEGKSTAKRIYYMDAPYKENVWQLMIYLKALGYKNGQITYAEKNNLKTKDFEIIFNQKIYDEAIAWVKNLHSHLKNKVIPKAEARMDTARSWECIKCPWWTQCHKDGLMENNGLMESKRI